MGPGKHCVVAENKIRFIKQKIRAMLNGLPYSWPLSFVHHLVYAAVKIRNMIPVRGAGTVMSPRESLTGIKCDANRDLRISTGEFVQADVPEMDNSMKERTQGAIALYGTGNRTGSVKFWHLATGQTIVRDTWTPIPLSDAVIKFINDYCAKQGGTATPKDPSITFSDGTDITTEDIVGYDTTMYPSEPLLSIKERPDNITGLPDEIVEATEQPEGFVPVETARNYEEEEEIRHDEHTTRRSAPSDPRSRKFGVVYIACRRHARCRTRVLLPTNASEYS